ncbi:uncharacterized protein LOC126822381 isoform X3 [Patella vulgata]|uniref:uncharacterized protein LOC126822381 isoform X3 n=1 Tax=Patella vulgata TaxID=6465 RepID=UPI0024A867BA|nr:uncharacterized protein LOC126822381 isoform X3 [Patella vulgata]
MDMDKPVKPPGMNKIQESMKPILVSLKLFGLFYDSTNNKIGVEDTQDLGSSAEKKTLNKILQKIYCWAVLCCLTISTLRHIPGFWTGAQGFTVPKVIFTTWSFQGVFSAILILFYCRNGTFAAYFRLWNKAIMDNKCICLGSLLTDLRRFSIICSVFAWGFWICNCVGVFLMVFIFNADFINSYTNPLPNNLIWKLILFLCHVYLSSIWVFSIALVLICSKSITNAFYLHSKNIGCVIKTNPKAFPEKLEMIRRKHLELCHLVDILDRPMRKLMVNVLGLNIFLACFILYQLINSSDTLLNTLMLMIWVLTAYLGLGSVSWFVAIVNEAGHSPLDHIYDSETDGLSTERLGQLTLFLSKLTGTSIGFTAMGFFTITKEVILTIVGLYLTYFFLLLQFRIT